MALPVLDGNQTATTLSSVVTGGEHIVAHSVVSLGATAIANITSAVSGSVVSISNFPSTQTIAGTVTVGNSITIGNFPAVQDVAINGNPAVYLVDDEQNPLGFGQYPILASIDGTANVAIKDQANAFITSTVTGSKRGIDANLISPVTIGSIPAISGSVTATISGTSSVTFSAITGSTSILNFPSTQTIAGTVTANLNGYSQTAVSYSGSSVTAIPVALQTNGIYGGTLLAYNGANTVLRVGLDAVGGTALASGNSVPVSGTVTVGNSVTISSLPAISGTVTVGNNNFNIKTVIAQDGSANFTAFNGTQFRLYTPTGASKTLNNIFGPTPSWIVAFSDSVTWFSDSGTQVGYFHDGTQWTLDDFTTPAGTLALDGSVFITNLSSESSINLLNGFTATQLGSAYVNGSGALRVSLYSSTVTAAAPNGSLTTRFGTPTTASVAFATSCVTNANRKYLLIQNVTTGSNVITVGIGFTPTTTQGIQLTAGAGITFESSYIPTGAVRILSSVTASNFTILEA